MNPQLVVLKTTVLPLNYFPFILAKAGFEPTITGNEPAELPLLYFAWMHQQNKNYLNKKEIQVALGLICLIFFSNFLH